MAMHSLLTIDAVCELEWAADMAALVKEKKLGLLAEDDAVRGRAILAMHDDGLHRTQVLRMPLDVSHVKLEQHSFFTAIRRTVSQMEQPLREALIIRGALLRDRMECC